MALLARRVDRLEALALELAPDKIYVNAIPKATEDLVPSVQRALEDKKEKIVYLKGDKDAKYIAIMEAMDSLRAVGIEDIGLITEPRKDPNAPAAGGK